MKSFDLTIRPSVCTSLNARPASFATATSVLCEGWVLKKRRKKMQGFARRYFTLYQSGLLSYAFEPGQPVRDQISLHNAAISTAPGRKDIHIDSNTATFHIKCLSTDDFSYWMTAFRSFISTGQEAKRSATLRHASRQASVHMSRSGTLIEEIGATIAELDKRICGLSQDLTHGQPQNTTLSKKTDKHSLKDSKFGIFKRPNLSSQLNPQLSEPSTSNQLLDPARTVLPENIQQVNALLEILKSQHLALSKTMQSSLILDTIQQSPSSLPVTREEGDENKEKGAASILTQRSYRDSMATTVSDSFEWFDALDEGFEGPQEFILEAAADGTESGSRSLPSESHSSLDKDNSSIDTDIDGLDLAVPPTQGLDGTSPTGDQVERRIQLPTPPVADEGSLFTILKKNVGKDLSTITFPVTFNEPLTLLQRAAEEVEYFSLLDAATASDDPITRISYVAAFAISGYAHTRYRTGRKGFTPMLSETFEDIRMKFIAEKVRHNPLEIAYHAEGEHWELNATSFGRTKFWGKSLEIIPLGTTCVRIGSDVYVWKKPSSFMRNLMVGTKYFEHCGQMTIENTTTQVRCVLDLKQNGYWGPANVVSGTVNSVDGDIIGRLEGKWDDQMCQLLDLSHLHVLWKAAPFPKNPNECYGFTSYGITLNEITSDIAGKLPPTDSRNRPDVRALEDGELDLAEREKERVEQLQRDRRNRGEDCRPRWFRQMGDGWQYTGGYWEMRARGWKHDDILPLW